MNRYPRYLIVTITALIALLTKGAPLYADNRGLKIQTASGPIDFYNDYHAIVIGVSDYADWPKIPNAVQDAIEVSHKLLSMGYNVKLVTDPDSAELNLLLTRVAWEKGREQNRALLVYFAGHGETVELADGSRLGYLIPKDCPLPTADPYMFDIKAVSMKTIEMLALKIKSRHVLMLFDACFSGSIFGLTRAAPSAISPESRLPVRQFITSGDANEQVPDKSMFKVCFLQALDGLADYNKDGYLTGSELGMYLQDHVIQYTRGNQHPQYGKINNPFLDKGDFVFEIERRTPTQSTETKTLHAASEDSVSPNHNPKDSPQAAPAETGNQRYDSIPDEVAKPVLQLRSESKKLSESDIRATLVEYHFFEKVFNPYGKFENRLNDVGNGTIFDERTGLIWQQGRSPRQVSFSSTSGYINQLNEAQYGGHSDWRLPTLEELSSLLESRQSIEGYIDPLFTDSKAAFWTVDTADPKAATTSYRAIWIISFSTGQIILSQSNPSGSGAFAIMPSNYVRAVRTAAE